MSTGEDLLEFQLKAVDIAFEREYRWNPERRWRADFKIAEFLVEIEGGSFNGGHRRGVEANKDCERHNDAVMTGWKPLRFTPQMVDSGEAVRVIEAALGRH